MCSGQEGLVVCPWLFCVLLSGTSHSPSQSSDTIFCHWLMMALTPRPCTEHTHFLLCMWHHGPHSVPHKGKPKSSNLYKVPHGRADCLTCTQNGKPWARGQEGMGRTDVRSHMETRGPGDTNFGHCRAALVPLSFAAH